MTLWMLWSILLAVIVGIAALAVDRAAGGFGAPRRHIWMVALLVSAIAPALLAFRRIEITRVITTPVSVVQADADLPEIPTTTTASSAVVPSAPAVSVAQPPKARTIDIITIDRAAEVFWIVASCILAVVFGRSMLQLRRQRSAWINAKVGEHPVLLSTEDGPAVIGFARPSIVFPRWALKLDARAQDMMLRHEREHIRTGDPFTLLVAGVVLIAFPWNAGLWWLVRRLRVAMELDCDARVIRSVGTSHEYGLMLLEVCARRTSLLPLASSLASARPLLERRIDAMSSPRPRRPWRAAIPFLAIALVASTAAAKAPRPAALRAPLIKVLQATPAQATPTQTTPAQPAPAQQRRAQPAPPAPAPSKPTQVPSAATAAPVPDSPTQLPSVATKATAAPRRTNAVPPAPAPAAATAAPVPTPAATKAPPAAPAPATAPAQPRKVDRAKIAALATQNAAAVVRGDTAADYVLMVFDAADKYQWTTHGLGNLMLAVGGDTRTMEERRDFSLQNRAQFMGATPAFISTGGVGATPNGIAAGGGMGASAGYARGGGAVVNTVSLDTAAGRWTVTRRDSGAVMYRDTLGGRVAMAGARGGGGGGRGGAVGTGGARGGAGFAMDTASLRGRLTMRADSQGRYQVVSGSIRFDGDSSVAPRRLEVVGGGGGGRGGRGGGAAAIAGDSSTRVYYNAVGSGVAMAGGGGGRGGGGGLSQTPSTLPAGFYLVGFGSSRNSQRNAGYGLQAADNGQSGIIGLPGSNISSSETYTFPAGELAPQMLRVIVVHLTPGTVWTRP